MKKTINDPIHGCIKYDIDLFKIVDTPQFQRLRHLHQNGILDYVFPGATHTRFSHSIGVGYLANKMINKIRKKQPELAITDKEVMCVTIAGLLHDLGHGPFSHTFEKFAHMNNIKFHHEKMSNIMVNSIFQNNNFNINITTSDIDMIKQLIDGNPSSKYASRSFLFEIVANKRNSIDVDKFDYLARDAYYAGMDEIFNSKRIIDGARVINNEICYPEKDVETIIRMYRCRYTLFKQVYTHRVANAIDLMICDALLYAKDHLKLEKRMTDFDDYINLNDNILHEIRTSKSSKLKKAKNILWRIDKRDFYKLVLELEIDYNEKIPITEELFETTKNIKLDKLDKGDIIIDVIINNYAMKNEDPLQYVHFYDKNDINTSFNIDPNEVSLYPNKFAEKIVRFFIKTSDDKKIIEFKNILKTYYSSSNKNIKFKI